MQHDVKTLMTGTPICIEPDASALAALDLMQIHGIRHLPVVDSGRRVLGVLSIDDLRAAFPVPVSLDRPPPAEERHDLADITVAEVMSFAPETIEVATPLEEAVQRMAERRIGCLPVVETGGELVGILSETDVLQALATMLWADRLRETKQRPDTTAVLREEHDRLTAKLAGYNRREKAVTAEIRDVPLDRLEEAADVQEAFLTEELAEIAARRLHSLERALERAEEGSLETCESCGGRIPSARLRALPETTVCIRCARAHEVR